MSGQGCGETNDRYCPDCYELVKAALKDVPARVRKSWKPATEVTFEQLKQWESEVKPGTPRRVGFPLFRIGDDNAVNEGQVVRIVYGKGEFSGRVYEYSYWPSKPDEVSITMETETDLETRATRPWRDFR